MSDGKHQLTKTRGLVSHQAMCLAAGGHAPGRTVITSDGRYCMDCGTNLDELAEQLREPAPLDDEITGRKRPRGYLQDSAAAS